MDGHPGVLSGTFAGRYTIERELGHGATATVYLARDTQRNRAVAIKVLRPELAESVGAERFLREIRVNEQLHHPHIVPVLDSGEHDGALYFVLPHMEGGSLRQIMHREKQLPIDDAVAIAHTIALALDYAHQRGLIHRDVKPENILFTGGQACLADFGIARAIERTIDESTTSTGLVRGTPAYMSPEQASGNKQYDGRTDTYSLACVLYEMIAGIPAFIGPTPESVIAQRFAHQPREIRVYRQSVPPALEKVIQKALEMTPADRHATAAEFASALDGARHTARAEPRTSGESVGIDRTKKIAFLGAGLVAVAVTAIGAMVSLNVPWLRGRTVPDSSRVVVLPLEGTSSPGMDQSFRGAFARWSGISIPGPLDVNDAIRNRGLLSSGDARAVAATLEAGRYVRGRALRVGEAFEIDVGLYDAPTNRELAHATTRVPVASAASDRTYFPVADSLLLRGATRAIGSGTSTLPAAQTFASAMGAVDDWDLQQADSILQSARTYDPSFPLAALWLAQVRLWRDDRPEHWLPLAQIAASDSTRLGEHERRLLSALLALGERRYRDACAQYRTLQRRNERDFAAWYGLGRCHADDHVVVRDRRSPSGWRFRSSYQQAVVAYAKAFELLPSVYRGFQRSAFAPLRALLFTRTTQTWPGIAQAPDTGRFIARPMWLQDTLGLIPYRAADLARVSPAQVRAIVRAVENQREVFRRIASSWSAALPNSAGAKEAVAVALQMRGDPTALDTLRRARQLSTSSIQQLRLAVAEVVLMVKTAIPDDTARLVLARGLADSLLAAHPQPQPGEGRTLARLAVLTNRCQLASDLSRRDAEEITLPGHIEGAVHSLTVGVILGCRNADDGELKAIAEAIGANATESQRRDELLYTQLGRIVRVAEKLDTGWLARIAGLRPATPLRARLALLRGDTAAVRSALRALREARGSWRPVDISLDALLSESRLLVGVSDTAAALSWIGPALNSARLLPEEALGDEVGSASFVRLAQLYSQLSSGSSQLAWKRALAILNASQP